MQKLLTSVFISIASFSSMACTNFSAWKESYSNELSELGFSKTAIDKVMKDAKYSKRVIGLDKNQPEFMFSFYGYLDRVISDYRKQKSKSEYQKLKPELDELYNEHGMDGATLTAFWAMETAFGEIQGNIRAKDALTTLSCDKRRSKFFSSQLQDYITLVEKGIFNGNEKSSWAGAMGHLQFMPDKVKLYATDGDGDGKIDIFNNRKDAFKTAAVYLNGYGWQKDMLWGQEVILPDDFNYELTGRRTKKSISQWQDANVKLANQEREWQQGENIQASIITPEGANGPAFIVYDNFSVIMRWNHSINYALAIGILSDEIAGRDKLHHVKPKSWQPITINQVTTVQSILKFMGYYKGEADGKWGDNSMQALKAWQKENSITADGNITMKIYNDIVIQAQTKLKKLNYYKGAIDGNWGSESQKALMNWLANSP